jgi:hypothetical protein
MDVEVIGGCSCGGVIELCTYQQSIASVHGSIDKDAGTRKVIVSCACQNCGAKHQLDVLELA